MGSGVTFRGKPLIESDYFEAANLGGKKIARQIIGIRTGVKLERKNKVDYRPAFKLAGERKEWILNTTNLKSLAKLYGHEAEAYVGQWVVLYGTIVDSFGEDKLAIRVDVDATRKYNANKNKAVQQPQQVEMEPEPEAPTEPEAEQSDMSEQELADAALAAEKQADDPGGQT